jgi:hypothetical protein
MHPGVDHILHIQQQLPLAATAQSKLAAYLWSQLDVLTPADMPVLAVQVMLGRDNAQYS